MEFNVPFQHKYGYIRDKKEGDKLTKIASVFQMSETLQVSIIKLSNGGVKVNDAIPHT